MANLPLNRTVIGTNLFIDIVAFSKTPVSQQFGMKSGLNRAIEKALAKVAEADRIVLDTGDGVAICFLGDPEEALFVANDIRDKTMELTGEEAQTLRIGINLGPIRIVKDMTGRTNVIGDGINVAQRVMGFAEENEILVSRSYYEVVARLREGNEQMFRGLGVRTDKHVREHQIYALLVPGSELAPTPAAIPTEAVARQVHEASVPPEESAPLTLDPQTLDDMGARLAQHIGPLAPVVVARALKSAPDVDAFLAAIAAAISDLNDRRAFLSVARERLGAGVEATSADAAAPADDDEQTVPDGAISDHLVETASAELAKQIGPIAPLLVKKALKDARNGRAFVEQLAARLPDEASRESFVSALRRLLATVDED